MTGRNRHPRLGVNAIAAAKPGAKEYTLWDGTLGHFGVRVHPSGVRSFIVQTRVRGRMRKITLGRFPEMGIEKARREAATVFARLWGVEAGPRTRPLGPQPDVGEAFRVEGVFDEVCLHQPLEETPLLGFGAGNGPDVVRSSVL